jgi:hypothetical protein
LIHTVVCLKWGTLYGSEYVNTLYSMVSRHLSMPFRLVCFTEDARDLRAEIDVQPLPDFEEPPWEYARYCSAWRKLALLQPGLAKLQGKVLFLDLDVVIVGSLEDMFRFSDRFTMIENWYQPGRGQASAFCFEAGHFGDLLARYQADPIRYLRQYRTEQAFLSGELGPAGRLAFFPDGWFASFKKHCMPSAPGRMIGRPNRLPEQARVIVFHGRPNPPDALVGQWGSKVVWYKRWHKRCAPTPWIAQHWR